MSLFVVGAIALGYFVAGARSEEHSKVPLPSYHYGAHIQVECLNRNM
jgi:hypothetical protein